MAVSGGKPADFVFFFPARVSRVFSREAFSLSSSPGILETPRCFATAARHMNAAARTTP
jgi:hypothetical protein